MELYPVGNYFTLVLLVITFGHHCSKNGQFELFLHLYMLTSRVGIKQLAGKPVRTVIVFSSFGPWSWFCVFCVARVLIVQCICPNAIWNNKLIPAPVPGFMYSNFSRFVPGKDLESNVSFLQETCETAVRHPLKFHYLKEGNFKGEKGAISRKRLKL